MAPIPYIMNNLVKCSLAPFQYCISLHRQVDYVSFESEHSDSKDNNKKQRNPLRPVEPGPFRVFNWGEIRRALLN